MQPNSRFDGLLYSDIYFAVVSYASAQRYIRCFLYSRLYSYASSCFASLLSSVLLYIIMFINIYVYIKKCV